MGRSLRPWGSDPARQSQPNSGWNKVVGIAVPFAKERTMRTIVVVALALLGMALTDTSADAGAWCANYRRGVSNCGYSSYAQCFATV